MSTIITVQEKFVVNQAEIYKDSYTQKYELYVKLQGLMLFTLKQQKNEKPNIIQILQTTETKIMISSATLQRTEKKFCVWTAAKKVPVR